MEGTEHHFGSCWQKEFSAISGGPLFSRPLCFAADRCPRDFLLFTLEELPLLPGHTPGRCFGGFQIIYVIFSLTCLFSESPDLPLIHGLRPWSQSPFEHRKTLEIKGFLGLERPFLDLVSQTPRPRDRGRLLFADFLLPNTIPAKTITYINVCFGL